MLPYQTEREKQKEQKETRKEHNEFSFETTYYVK